MNDNWCNFHQIHYTDFIERTLVNPLSGGIHRRYAPKQISLWRGRLIRLVKPNSNRVQLALTSIAHWSNEDEQREPIERDLTSIRALSCAASANRPPWGSYVLRSGPQTAISHVQTELLGRERGEMRGPSSNFPALMRDRGSASRLSAR